MLKQFSTATSYGKINAANKLEVLKFTAAIFFLANLYLKQGISSEYAIVDFICMGLLDPWGAWTENNKMKNSCPQWDSNPGPSA